MKHSVNSGFTWLLRKSLTRLLFTSGARRGSGQSCGWTMPFPAGTWLIHSLGRIHTWAPGRAAAGTGTHRHPCGQKGNMETQPCLPCHECSCQSLVQTGLSLLFTALSRNRKGSAPPLGTTLTSASSGSWWQRTQRNGQESWNPAAPGRSGQAALATSEAGKSSVITKKKIGKKKKRSEVFMTVLDINL